MTLPLLLTLVFGLGRRRFGVIVLPRPGTIRLILEILWLRLAFNEPDFGVTASHRACGYTHFRHQPDFLCAAFGKAVNG